MSPLRYAPPKMKKTRKYKPQYAQFREWYEIENWYLELIEGGLDFKPMLNLVRYWSNPLLIGLFHGD
jgi:hypothetical protein